MYSFSLMFMFSFTFLNICGIYNSYITPLSGNSIVLVISGLFSLNDFSFSYNLHFFLLFYMACNWLAVGHCNPDFLVHWLLLNRELCPGAQFSYLKSVGCFQRSAGQSTATSVRGHTFEASSLCLVYYTSSILMGLGTWTISRPVSCAVIFLHCPFWFCSFNIRSFLHTHVQISAQSDSMGPSRDLPSSVLSVASRNSHLYLLYRSQCPRSVWVTSSLHYGLETASRQPARVSQAHLELLLSAVRVHHCLLSTDLQPLP